MTDTPDQTPTPPAKATLVGRISTLGRCLCDGARMMVGVPNYDTYVAHMRATHPEGEVMSYEAFFRNRLDARFGAGPGNGGFRCC